MSTTNWPIRCVLSGKLHNYCRSLIIQFNILQKNDKWNIKINHNCTRKHLVNVVMILLLFVMKTLCSWYTRSSNEMGSVDLYSQLSYAISFDITTITFSFHYIFFIATLQNRFSNFIENFKQSASSRLDKSIDVLDEFLLVYATFESLIEQINSIFWLQVIEFQV